MTKFARFKLIILMGLLIAGLTLAACGQTAAPTAPLEPVTIVPTVTDIVFPTAAPTATAPPTVTEEPETAGMANPASVYCEEQGGTLEIRDTVAGQVGYCIFPDGSECEEWAFYNGECAPGAAEETPAPAADVNALIAQVQETIPADAFEGLQAQQLDSDAPLWVVFSYGLRNYDLDPVPGHFIAIYTPEGAGWREVARLELVSDDRDVLMPDYLAEGGVTQVDIEPSRVWLAVHGGAGAHSGTYQLLSFDGSALQVELSHFSPSPGMAGVMDVNGDGANDVVLDASDPYVFCYACGVRKIMYQVYEWNAAAQELQPVELRMMAEEHPARAANDRAVELAHAGLWKDAMAKIAEAQEAAADAPESPILAWNHALIKMHADAMANAAPDSGYPLLSHIFYGDYAAALELLRPYGAEELFSTTSPLITGTVAMGWEPTLTDYVIKSTNAALEVKPDLAAAYFLRGWAEYLSNPSGTQAQADIAHAAELNPAEPLYQMMPERVETTVDNLQVSFDLAGLAERVHRETLPAVTYNPNMPPLDNGMPAHLRFTFDDDELSQWFAYTARQLRIFPVEEYIAIFAEEEMIDLEARIALLQSLIETRPTEIEGEIPMLPFINAAQVFRVQVKYLDFAGGAGVRFVTYYAQDVSPIRKELLAYVFQGLTANGKYYVSFCYPVATAALPDAPESMTSEEYEQFAQNYESYMQETLAALNAATDYSPDLAKLDALIQSLRIEEGAE